MGEMRIFQRLDGVGIELILYRKSVIFEVHRLVESHTERYQLMAANADVVVVVIGFLIECQFPAVIFPKTGSAVGSVSQ